MPPRECDVARDRPRRRVELVHDVVLQKRERVQQLQTGGGAQCRPVIVGTAQPPQIHERRPHALATVDEFSQYLGRDVDTGGL